MSYTNFDVVDWIVRLVLLVIFEIQYIWIIQFRVLENQDTVGPLENEPKSTFHFSAIESSGNQD